MNDGAPAAVLLAAARSCRRDTIAVIGTAKHVGKTVTVLALLDAARKQGISCGVLSLGRDGEERDAFDDRPKPKIVVRAGMLAVVSRRSLRVGLAVSYRESLRASNALGELVLVRAISDVELEITGPPGGEGLAEAVALMRRDGAECICVDGALDRMAALSAIDPAIILASGTSAHRDVQRIARELALLVERLQLPAPPDDLSEAVFESVVDAEALHTIVARNSGNIVVADPLRMTHDAFVVARKTHRLWSRRNYVVAGCSVNAYSPQFACSPERLLTAVARHTQATTVDILAGTVLSHAR